MNLTEMLAKHRQGKYYLHHWTGYFKSSFTARQAGRRIVKRMTDTIPRAMKVPAARAGIDRMRVMANLLVRDLWGLPHPDFKQLQKLTDEFLMTNTHPAEGLPFWMQKESPFIRFED